VGLPILWSANGAAAQENDRDGAPGNAYRKAMVKVPGPWQLDLLQPGDLLVYEFSEEELAAMKARHEDRAGHVVMLVSPEDKVIVGSHGAFSTPEDAVSGVGYRGIVGSMLDWTEGRILRAVYRLRPELERDISVARRTSHAFTLPARMKVSEEQMLRISVEIQGRDPESLRVYAVELPPGAVWDAKTRQIQWQPDFTHGGGRYAVEMAAVTPEGRFLHADSIVEVEDSIHPPEPQVVSERSSKTQVQIRVRQISDAFLDDTSRVGATYDATVLIPTSSHSLNVPERLASHAQARNIFLSVHYGKDDPLIHSASSVGAGVLAKVSMIQSLEALRVPHFVSWDDGGDGGVDPEIGAPWWQKLSPEDRGLNRMQVHRPLIAFSQSSLDDHPGSGGRFGSINGCLSWREDTVIDEEFRFAAELFLSPFCRSKEAVVDVAPRRLRRFHPSPDETVVVKYGTERGEMSVSSDGLAESLRLKVTGTPTRLSITRHPWRPARRRVPHGLR
jgi:hypothetical protein